MKYPWREDGRRDIYEGSRFIAVFDRTKPKPRPEGYRNFSEEGTIGHETCKMVGRGMFMPEDELHLPAEALEPSQTGEVPPEPSKGRGEAARGVERAPDDCRTSTQVKFDLGFRFH